MKPARSRYGGPWFSAASTLPLNDGLTGLRRAVKIAAAGIRRPQRAGALIKLITRTQSAGVVVSGSPAGLAVLAYLTRRSLRVLPQNRLCQGVLLLPDDHSEYLRGRSRQALRTNLRRAAAAGIVCEAMVDPALAGDDVSEILNSRRTPLSEAENDVPGTDWAALIAQPHTTFLIARDQKHRPLAFMAAVIDDTACLIKVAVASNHEARWALHDHLVRRLIDSGITCVLVEGGGPFGALGLAPHEQYYQRLLGYELRHVIPVTAHPVKRRKRLLAAVTQRRPPRGSH